MPNEQFQTSNRFQRLFVKFYNPTIKLAEKIDFKDNIILVGNSINKYDPIFVSLINKDINFILKEDNCFYRYLNKEIIDLSDKNIENMRRAFIYYIENNPLCIFPFDDDIKLQNNNNFELIAKSRAKIIPFGITGKYKSNGNLKLETGPGFETLDCDPKIIKSRCEEEVKKLIKK